MKEAHHPAPRSTSLPGANDAGALRALDERGEAARRTRFAQPVDLLLDDITAGAAEIVASDFCDDPTIPPPGRRSGTGTSTIVPYLVRTLAAKPRDPMEPHPTADDESHPAARR